MGDRVAGVSSAQGHGNRLGRGKKGLGPGGRTASHTGSSERATSTDFGAQLHVCEKFSNAHKTFNDPALVKLGERTPQTPAGRTLHEVLQAHGTTGGELISEHEARGEMSKGRQPEWACRAW